MGYVYSLIAALLFGANGSVTKVIVGAGLTPAQLTFFRVLTSAVLAGLILLLTDRRAFRVSVRQLVDFALLGVVGVALLQFTYAVALSLLPVGITLLIEYTAVLMVAVIAFFFLHEQVKARLWVAIGFVLAGLAVVAQIGASVLNPAGVLIALCAAISLTVYFLGGERAVRKAPPLAVAFWTMLFATVFWAVFSGWWQLDPAVLTTQVSLTGNLEGVVVSLWLPLAWNVVLGSFVTFLLSLIALGRLKATTAGIVASSEVIFAFVVAWLWLGEELDGAQIVGAALVLGGIILAQTARTGRVVDADLALADYPPR